MWLRFCLRMEKSFTAKPGSGDQAVLEPRIFLIDPLLISSKPRDVILHQEGPHGLFHPFTVREHEVQIPCKSPEISIFDRVYSTAIPGLPQCLLIHGIPSLEAGNLRAAEGCGQWCGPVYSSIPASRSGEESGVSCLCLRDSSSRVIFTFSRADLQVGDNE